MKHIIATTLLLTALTFNASAFLFPSNPPPVVNITIIPSTDPTVTNYFIYYGVGSRQYTNKTAVGNSTNVSLPLPARGVTYFIAATAQDNFGLESTNFSNEVSYTPKLPPIAPGLAAPITLTIQTTPTLNPPIWVDTDAVWSIPPWLAQQYFRTKIEQPPQIASATFRRTKIPNAAIKFPPGPTTR